MFKDPDQALLLHNILRQRTHPIDKEPELFLQNYPNPPQYPTILNEEDDFPSVADREEKEAKRLLYGGKRKKKRKRSSTDIPGSCENLPIPCDLRLPNKEFPEGLYPIHNVCAFVGPRGSGKTTALINLVANYLKYDAFDRIHIISPTYDSNPEYDLLFKKLQVPEEAREQFICTDPNAAPMFLSKMLIDFRNDGKLYEDHMKYVDLYNKWIKGQPLTTQEMDIMSKRQFSEPAKFDRPSAALIVDDMTHTPLLSRFSSYPHLLIKHRHVGGTNLGISIFTLVHNFKSGIPKCARQNVQVYHIWPSSDDTQIKSIWEETCGGTVPFKEFYGLYKQAIEDKEALKSGEQGHNFFVVDPYNKVFNKRFRRNFNEYLTSNSTIEQTTIEPDTAINNLPIDSAESKS